MPRYEYKLVPAPEKAARQKGLKGAARFAATLEALMNALGAEGWRYLRADTLPQEERAGLASRVTTYRNLLVFQRELPEPPTETAPEPDHGAEADPATNAPEVYEPEADEEAALANLFAETEAPPENPDGSKP
jgi:hypothetical protein